MDDPFDFKKKLADPHIRSRIADYIRDGDTAPLRIDLDVTTDCNYACPHCGDLARKHLNRGGLGIETLMQVVEDFVTLGVMHVSIIGGGEPTASPHIEPLIRALHARNMRVGVTTNGSLITQSLAEAMAASCTWVRFSLDAASDSLYQRCHKPQGNVSLDVVLSNLRLLARLMPGRVGVSFLITNQSVPEICDAARLAKENGSAYIRFRVVQHPITGKFLPIRNANELARQLAEAASYEGAGFAVSIGGGVDDTQSADDSLPIQPKCYGRCHVQAIGTLISGDGNVYVCSKWRGDPRACIGNVVTHRLTDLWRSERRKHVISTLDPSIMCANVFCQAHDYNMQVHELRKSQGKTIPDQSHETCFV